MEFTTDELLTATKIYGNAVIENEEYKSPLYEIYLEEQLGIDSIWELEIFQNEEENI